jgi:ribosomal protein S18 acetylase RimI-like enzyme
VPLRLRPMSDDELPAFIEHGKGQYARDMIENAGLTEELAQTKTDQDWARLLPNGRVPTGHHIYVVEDEDAQRVGDLWFAERSTDFEGTGAFVYSIEIDEVFRGKGYGRATMELLEDEVRAAGLDRIALNVFGGNEVARSLYRSLGYRETAVMMRKELRSR